MAAVTAPTTTPVDRDVDSGPPMVHLTEHPNGMVALCGARLRGIDPPASAPLDCHVCAELDGGAW